MQDSTFPLYPERRALIQLAILSAVLLVGWYIPLPGLDLDSILQLNASLDSVSSRISILALGVTPFFTVLALLEIAKLAAPPLERWQSASARNARHLAVVVLVLSLALAAYQAFGVLVAMDTSAMVRRDALAFIPVGIATFIGATALIIWLSDNFGLSDLGGGFWPLMAIMVLADLPTQIASLVEVARIGQISGGQLLAVAAMLVAALAFVVFANKLLSANAPASGHARIPMLLWPSYLANIVAGYAIVLLPADMRDWPFVSVSFVETAYVAIVTLLIPVFVFAYAGLLCARTKQTDRWPLPIVLAICAIQMVLYVALWLLPINLGIPPTIYGGELLVLGTVILALFGTHTPARDAAV